MARGKRAGAAARAECAAGLLEARLGEPKGRTRPFPGGLAGLLVETLARERRLAAAWAAARRHGCPEGTWLALAEASDGDMPGEALAVYERLVERQAGLASKHGYAAARRLVAGMGSLRARHGEGAAHRADVEALLARHRGPSGASPPCCAELPLYRALRSPVRFTLQS